MSAASRLQAHRRRSMVDAAWRNVFNEAHRIARERDMSHDEAIEAVMGDRELLDKCHRVHEPVAPMPRSTIESQNE